MRQMLPPRLNWGQSGEEARCRRRCRQSALMARGIHTLWREASSAPDPRARRMSFNMLRFKHPPSNSKSSTFSYKRPDVCRDISINTGPVSDVSQPSSVLAVSQPPPSPANTPRRRGRAFQPTISLAGCELRTTFGLVVDFRSCVFRNTSYSTSWIPRCQTWIFLLPGMNVEPSTVRTNANHTLELRQESGVPNTQLCSSSRFRARSENLAKSAPRRLPWPSWKILRSNPFAKRSLLGCSKLS